MVEDWALARLALQMRAEMHEELGHADNFMQRIMFLKGTPNMVPAMTPKRAQSLTNLFEADLADERDAIKLYPAAARAAGEADDIGTRALFEKIALDENGHMAWLDLQLDLLQRIGEPAHIAKHMVLESEEG